MSEWQAVEIVDGKTKLKGKGTEGDARRIYRQAVADGTTGRLLLLDANGVPQDEFGSVDLGDGNLTGMPVKEYAVPLPPSLLEAAAKARESPPIELPSRLSDDWQPTSPYAREHSAKGPGWIYEMTVQFRDEMDGEMRKDWDKAFDEWLERKQVELDDHTDKPPEKPVPIPDDWEPNVTTGSPRRRQDIEGEAVKFRAWAKARGVRQRNWDKAFENWLLATRGPGGAPIHVDPADTTIPPAPLVPSEFDPPRLVFGLPPIKALAIIALLLLALVGIALSWLAVDSGGCRETLPIKGACPRDDHKMIISDAGASICQCKP